MSNKWILAIGSITVIALIALAAAAVTIVPAMAQGPQPPNDGQPYCGGAGCRNSAGGLGGGLRFGASGHSLVDITAQVTGLDAQAVVAELQAGKTFAQIAEANGKTAQDLVNAFVADRKTVLDEAVAAGRISREQADTLLNAMQTNVEQHVNSAWQPRGAGHSAGCSMHKGGGRFFRGGMGRWGNAPSGSPTGSGRWNQ